MKQSENRKSKYEKESLSLWGAVSLGTGVMIGAGIFALTGQIAELANNWFPLAFLVAAIVASFSAYSYVKLSNKWPSAGGIAMFLEKAYGKTAITGSCALLMYFSMVINESLVARTFGAYSLQLFNVDDQKVWVPILGVLVLLFAFLINILGNKSIQTFSFFMAFVKAVGLLVLAIGGFYASGLSIEKLPSSTIESPTFLSFFGAVALGVLAYKGFTTITNSGGEIKNPTKNVGRAIIVSILISVVLYLLVAFSVQFNLSIDEIVRAKDYSLAQAARPAFGNYGLWFTVLFAIVATVSGVIASVFAVSRMLAMLTEMKLVPHSHFGMPGDIQKHTLVYTIVFAMLLTVFFDLSRIASIGAVFYIFMDIMIHWGVLRYLREEVGANRVVLITAILLDIVVLAALIWVKVQTDIFVVLISIVGMALIFLAERYFLKLREN